MLSSKKATIVLLLLVVFMGWLYIWEKSTNTITNLLSFNNEKLTPNDISYEGTIKAMSDLDVKAQDTTVDPDAQDVRSLEKAENTMQFLQEMTSFNFTDSDPERAPVDTTSAAGATVSSGANLGTLLQYTYKFPDNEIFYAYGSQIKNNPALNDIFNEVASKVGIPAKYLRAVMSRECPQTFALTAEQVAQYSAPGGEVPFCKDADAPNYSDGPMQFMDSTWPSFAAAVNTFGGYTHEPKVQNIRDSVYAAAMMLKQNVLISDEGQSSGVWIRQDVVNAVGCYATGACKKQVSYDSLGQLFKNYVDNIWEYYSKT